MNTKKNAQQQNVGITVGGNVGGNIQIDDHHTESDASVSNVTAGGDVKIATGGATITEGGAKDAEQMSVAEVLQLFQKMLTEIETLNVSEDQKRTAKKHVKQAIAEVEEEKKPDKRTVAEFLKKATEVLKEGGVTATQAVAFGQLVGTAAAWLGKTLVWFGL
jgi:tRNA-dihydrouridine synthase